MPEERPERLLAQETRPGNPDNDGMISVVRDSGRHSNSIFFLDLSQLPSATDAINDMRRMGVSVVNTQGNAPFTITTAGTSGITVGDTIHLDVSDPGNPRVVDNTTYYAGEVGESQGYRIVARTETTLTLGPAEEPARQQWIPATADRARWTTFNGATANDNVPARLGWLTQQDAAIIGGLTRGGVDQAVYDASSGYSTLGYIADRMNGASTTRNEDRQKRFEEFKQTFVDAGFELVPCNLYSKFGFYIEVLAATVLFEYKFEPHRSAVYFGSLSSMSYVVADVHDFVKVALEYIERNEEHED